MAKSNKGSLKDCIAYIGCGEYPMQGAINVDIRKLPGVDIVADAKKLPFKKGEIGFTHAVESMGLKTGLPIKL